MNQLWKYFRNYMYFGVSIKLILKYVFSNLKGSIVLFLSPWSKNRLRLVFAVKISKPCRLCFSFLPPANEVGEGYVFTRVCLSTGRGSTYAGPPPGQVHPPGTKYTPWDQETPRPGTSPGPGTPPPDQIHPPGPGTHPLDQVHAPGPGTPLDQVHPQIRYTPRTRYTPQSGACWEIQATNRR